MSKSQEERILEIAELMDNLKSEEYSPRMRSVRSLSVIAEAIGPDRTRNELVPFLSGLTLLQVIFVFFLYNFFLFYRLFQ